MGDITAAAIHDFPATEIIDLPVFLPPPSHPTSVMYLSVHANARAFKSHPVRPGAGCIVLPPADPRGVIDHGLPGVARGINHRSRRLALANLSSASEALNLSTGQRTVRSGAARFARRTHTFSKRARFEKRPRERRTVRHRGISKFCARA